MAPPPSFGDREYWDNRFSKEAEFEWLLDFAHLKPYIEKTKTAYTQKVTHKPQLLHIGCGSSRLSFDLRYLFGGSIHNVDYSSEAIRKGYQLERELRSDMSGKTTPGHWSEMDLLDVNDVLRFRTQRDANCRYDLILDKSTSDAISCASDVEINLPYALGTPDQPIIASEVGRVAMHPLYVLAINLAYLAVPGSYWIVFSYSNARFPFWDHKAEVEAEVNVSDSVLNAGFTHPKLLWQLLKHEEIVKTASVEDSSPVHRPPETYHFYTLERTGLVVEHVNSTDSMIPSQVTSEGVPVTSSTRQSQL